MRPRLLFPLLLLCACKQEPIVTYRVPKEAAPAVPFAAVRPGSISWDVPSGWEQKAPSQMRAGSFIVKGTNGATADVSVVALSGDAGGDLANVNRWRGQISLPPIAEVDLAKQSRMLTVDGHPMRVVDFTGDVAGKRLIAAIASADHTTWFFKMVGDIRTVATAKPQFLAFLQSVKFHDTR